MKQRIITALCLIAVCVPIILLGKNAAFVLCAVACVAAHIEYSNVVSASRFRYADVFFGFCALICSRFIPWLCLPLFLLGASFVMISGIVEGSTQEKTDSLMYRIWGFYIPAAICMATRIMYMRSDGYFIFLATAASCVACDTFAYFAGTKFGKHKLCPLISPKKSIEGSIAGFASAVVVFCLFGLFPSVELSGILLAVAGSIVGIFSQFGDLSASIVKRRFDVKDYGHIFPGHGGILDRIDAMLFSFMYVYIFLLVVIQ